MSAGPEKWIKKKKKRSEHFNPSGHCPGCMWGNVFYNKLINLVSTKSGLSLPRQNTSQSKDRSSPYYPKKHSQKLVLGLEVKTYFRRKANSCVTDCLLLLLITYFHFLNKRSNQTSVIHVVHIASSIDYDVPISSCCL